MTTAHRLAAILAVDVVGYSRLMGEDGGDAVMQPLEHYVQLLARSICRTPVVSAFFVLSLRMGAGQFNGMLRDRRSRPARLGLVSRPSPAQIRRCWLRRSLEQ
jgi:hypothetical protein